MKNKKRKIRSRNNGGRTHRKYIDRNFKKYYTDAVKIAQSLKMPWIQVEDRVALGLVALINAIKNFNSNNPTNATFGTYLYKVIKDAMYGEIYSLNKTPLADTVRISWKEKTKCNKDCKKNCTRHGNIVTRHSIIPDRYTFSNIRHDEDEKPTTDIYHPGLSEQWKFDTTLEINEFILLLRKRLSPLQNKILDILVDPADFIFKSKRRDVRNSPHKFNQTTLSNMLGYSRQRVAQIIQSIREEAKKLEEEHDRYLLDPETGQIVYSVSKNGE